MEKEIIGISATVSSAAVITVSHAHSLDSFALIICFIGSFYGVISKSKNEPFFKRGINSFMTFVAGITAGLISGYLLSHSIVLIVELIFDEYNLKSIEKILTITLGWMISVYWPIIYANAPKIILKKLKIGEKNDS